MEGLLLRLSALDADAESAVRVINFFDRLISNRVDLPTLVRDVATLTGRDAGVHSPHPGLSVRAPARTRAPGSAADRVPAVALTHELADGTVVWVAGDHSGLPLADILLERFAIATEVVLDHARATEPALGDPALVELALSASAGEAERARALHLLGLATTTPIRILALAGPPTQLATLTRGRPTAHLGQAHALLLTGPAAAPNHPIAAPTSTASTPTTPTAAAASARTTPSAATAFARTTGATESARTTAATASVSTTAATVSTPATASAPAAAAAVSAPTTPAARTTGAAASTPAAAATTAASAPNTATTMAEAILGPLPPGVTVGVSARSTAEHGPARWRSARIALRFATPRAPVVHAADLGALALLADRLDPADLAAEPDVRALDTLAAEPHGAELLDVLAALCATHSIRQAAAAVNRHHSTIPARLTHAESVLGFPLDSPDGRFRLRLALVLRTLRDTATNS